MNLKRSPFSILNKKRREIDYIKGVYKRKIQAEIESYKDPEDEDKRDTIQAQDVLMLDRFSILNKESREIDYIKGVYKRKIKAEIESYKDPEDKDLSLIHI